MPGYDVVPSCPSKWSQAGRAGMEGARPGSYWDGRSQAGALLGWEEPGLGSCRDGRSQAGDGRERASSSLLHSA